MAGSTNIRSAELVFGYYLPYNLTELQALMLGVVFPTKPSLGFTVYQTGGALLRNQQLALTAASAFEKIKIGVRVKYLRTAISGLGAFSAITVDLGLQLELTNKLLVGSYISNVSGSKLGQDHSLPMIIASGIQYQLSDKLLTLLEVAHRIGEVLEIRQGVEYELKSRFKMRTGFTTYGRQGYLGFTLRAFKIKIDYALTFHPYLGVNHQTGVSYSLL